MKVRLHIPSTYRFQDHRVPMRGRSAGNDKVGPVSGPHIANMNLNLSLRLLWFHMTQVNLHGGERAINAMDGDEDVCVLRQNTSTREMMKHAKQTALPLFTQPVKPKPCRMHQEPSARSSMRFRSIFPWTLASQPPTKPPFLSSPS